MKRSHLRRSGAPSAMLLLVLTAIAGCAVKDSNARWWRTGTVVQTMPRSAIPADVDATCAAAGSVAAPADPTDDFALVRFKAGRAPYVKLFPVAKGLSLNVGDRVDVEPGVCKLRRGNIEGS